MSRVLIQMRRLIHSYFHRLQLLILKWTKPSRTSLLLGTVTDLARGKPELVAENVLHLTAEHGEFFGKVEAGHHLQPDARGLEIEADVLQKVGAGTHGKWREEICFCRAEVPDDGIVLPGRCSWSGRLPRKLR